MRSGHTELIACYFYSSYSESSDASSSESDIECDALSEVDWVLIPEVDNW